ncbi:unnamed protein product [Prorocentrum cordatum]|uniref:Uncharacterized protein n=1 Tax=Prorocentrum cordatum TaxID=2364126 RepID=A0ABN9SQG3_9DINO|nr:unnamed protein product [Polarella glacialis]
MCPRETARGRNNQSPDLGANACTRLARHRKSRPPGYLGQGSSSGGRQGAAGGRAELARARAPGRPTTPATAMVESRRTRKEEEEEEEDCSGLLIAH